LDRDARRCGPAPRGEVPHGDLLGTAGTDRITEPVHVGLNKQQQVRLGERAQRCRLVVRKELEQAILIACAVGQDLGPSHASAANSHI
jgi:hypothetical protein